MDKLYRLGGFRNLGPRGSLPPPRPTSAPGKLPEGIARGADSRAGPTLPLAVTQRRAPWHTFEFANRLGVRGLLWAGGSLLPLPPRQTFIKEPRNLESLGGCHYARGGRTTPARARRSRHRRTNLDGLASLSLFFFFFK